jgi:hypothetical protein
MLGGQVVMDCPISPVRVEGTLTSQFTEAALLQFDPTLPTSQQFSLAPLGLKTGITDPPLDIQNGVDKLVIDGIVVFEKFIPRFNALGGTRYVGRPIGQPRVDPDNLDIIQYFENVAFYTSSVDPKDGVHLVTLGSLNCPEDCIHPPVRGFYGGDKPHFSEPFLEDVLRLGRDLFGNPVSSYYRTQDGYIEQIYDNVVVHSNLVPPFHIDLQPVPSWVGYNNTLPFFQPMSRDPSEELIFNPLNNSDQGFNEAIVFEQFVANHGGKDKSGAVISQIFTVGTSGNIYRQCYVKYCLDFFAVGQSIRPAPLGAQYLREHPIEAAAKDALILKPVNTILRTSEINPLITSREKQTINILVFQSGDQHPLPNLDAVLTTTLPDGAQVDYVMPATDFKGMSSFTLDPIPAANGTLIQYKVCLNPLTPTPICAKDTFTIWGNP